MIPFDYITEWRAEAPWIDDAQVEQDLVISRALVEIFRHPALADSLALRGGTALSKLQLRPPARYSEDIDLVQTTAQPAGPMMNALRAVLEHWLGKPNDGDLQEVYDTERQLLYVACTRARDRLSISGVEPASEFLDDVRAEHGGR